jgi:hypothetical protein
MLAGAKILEKMVLLVTQAPSEKAPGKSGITTDMLKKLPPEGFNLLTIFIQNYWQDINCDFDSWHTNILSLLYKGKKI